MPIFACALRFSDLLIGASVRMYSGRRAHVPLIILKGVADASRSGGTETRGILLWAREAQSCDLVLANLRASAGVRGVFGDGPAIQRRREERDHICISEEVCHD